MKCPICTDTELVMTERQAVEIDYCPKCRGVWLDRGELDKIIERSLAEASDKPTASSYPAGYTYPARHGDHHGHDSHGHHRRKSWLGELFD